MAQDWQPMRKNGSDTRLSKSWRAVLMLDPCVYCGEQADGLDHIVPATRGGHDGWTNRTPACARCDQLKRNAQLILFLWACDKFRRRVERRKRLRTIQQRVGAWQAGVRNRLAAFDPPSPAPGRRD